MKAKQLVPRRTALMMAIAGSALLLLPCVQASAGFFGRAVNSRPLPQPLPSGLYSQNHLGAVRSDARLSFPVSRFPVSHGVCVAWGRVCVKAGRGTPTHEAPCAQYEFICRKYA
jgi:hypothetical protein